ncbi:hypothetical protein HK097_002423 [Rhizophlyctis rosea]|uniref:Carbohydrate esterase family 16 protein n=1 Tax=Rhizophlyctis rosea TaxID=64517 RepID=A0AAD5X450_9FUNG|nr:hypothetical protein HK097_002423 [Rhizophlyctis rosea]
MLNGFAAGAAYSKNKFFPQINDIVSFGDSYTDESRLGYFIGSKGVPPPVGWVAPPSNTTASGGKSWPRIVSDNTGIELHNYAVSGAVCSNKLTPKYCDGCLPADVPFPSVTEYEVPAFLADQKQNPRKPLVDLKKTIFTIWIGTNDLGNGALITDNQLNGATLPDVTNCAVNAVKKLYANGARNFIFQNVAPLHRAPQYNLPSLGGVGSPNHYWPSKEQDLKGNLTLATVRMKELVYSANEIYKYQIKDLAKELKGAKIAQFDSFGLISDILNKPKQYLAAPYNATGYSWHCQPGNCGESYTLDKKDGYAWYDELHPSERTSRVIADEIAKTIAGKSKWATYYEN